MLEPFQTPTQQLKKAKPTNYTAQLPKEREYERDLRLVKKQSDWIKNEEREHISKKECPYCNFILPNIISI